MTNAQLVRLCARVCRMVADELERAAQADARQPSTRTVDPPATPPDDVSRRERHPGD